MTNEIAKGQKCIVIRNGVHIWIEEGERLEKLEAILRNVEGNARFQWEGRTINTADLVGIFLPADMEDMTLRKNGKWQCDKGSWHSRQDKCECTKQGYTEAQEEHFRNFGYYPTN